MVLTAFSLHADPPSAPAIPVTTTGTQTLTNKTLADSNGNTVLALSGATSAINHVLLLNSAAGNPVLIESDGGDAAIPLMLTPKGGAAVQTNSQVIAGNIAAASPASSISTTELVAYNAYTGTGSSVGTLTRLDWTPNADSSSSFSAIGTNSAVFSYGINAIAGNLTGITATATNRGDNTIQLIDGFTTHLGNQTNTYGSTHTGTVAQLNGVHIYGPIADASDPITTVAGIYIETQGGAGIGTAYGIYQAGSDADYFAGPITAHGITNTGAITTGIGSAATPAVRFTTGTTGGIFSNSGGDLSIATNGTLAANWDGSQNFVNAGSITGTGINGNVATIKSSGNASLTLWCTSPGSSRQWSVEHTTTDLLQWTYYNGSAYIFPFRVTNTGVIQASALAEISGANAKAGTFTLTAGTVTVANTAVTANSVIVCTVKTVSGTRAGTPDIVPTAGTGFVATGGGADTSTYNYVIIEVD